MSVIEIFDSVKPLAYQAVTDLREIVDKRRPPKWNSAGPRMGEAFYYDELKELQSLSEFQNEILSVAKKRDDETEGEFKHKIERLVESFIEVVVGTPNKEELEDAFNYWWQQFCFLLNTEQITVRIMWGLSNFKADKPEYKLEDNVTIKFFSESNLREKVFEFVDYWDTFHLLEELTDSDAQLCSGMLLYDYSFPATGTNIVHPEFRDIYYRNHNIVIKALRLSGAGRLHEDPWLLIKNPKFPYRDVRIIDSATSVAKWPGEDSLQYMLNDTVWKRVLLNYRLLKRLYEEEDDDLDDDRGMRKQLINALWRFNNTFEQGIWPSTLVDLVIVLESLYLFKKRGGRLDVVFAASNLLGRTHDEARIVFESFDAAYQIRNSYVHGNLIEQGDWESFLEHIIQLSGMNDRKPQKVDPRSWAFEILRDYVRRTIAAFLNMLYSEDSTINLDRQLVKELTGLHFYPEKRKKIQTLAKCYPLEAM